MKIKKIIPLTIALLTLTTLGSCNSSSSDTKQISEEEFLNAYDEMVKKRGSLENYVLTNYSVTENNLQEVKKTQILCNYDYTTNCLMALPGDKNIPSMPIGFSESDALYRFIKTLDDGENVKSTYENLQGGAKKATFIGHFAAYGDKFGEFDGQIVFYLNPLGYVIQYEIIISSAIKNEDKKIVVEFDAPKAQVTCDIDKWIETYNEIKEKRETIFEIVKASKESYVDEDENIDNEKNFPLITNQDGICLGSEARSLLNTYVAFNNDEQINNFLNQNGDIESLGIVNDNLLCVKFSNEQSNNDLEEIYVFGDGGYATNFYVEGRTNDHDINFLYNFISYFNGEEITEDRFFEEYQNAINKGKDKSFKMINAVGSIKTQKDSRIQKDILFSKDLLKKEEKNIENAVAVSYNSIIFEKYYYGINNYYETSSGLKADYFTLKEQFTSNAEVQFLKANDLLSFSISGMNDGKYIETSVFFDDYGYLTAHITQETNTSSQYLDNILNQLYIFVKALVKGTKDKETVSMAYGNAIKLRDEKTYSSIYSINGIYFQDNNEPSKIEFNLQKKEKCGFYDPKIRSTYNTYQTYDTVNAFYNFLESLDSLQGEIIYNITEKNEIFVSIINENETIKKFTCYGFSNLGYLTLLTYKVESSENHGEAYYFQRYHK